MAQRQNTTAQTVPAPINGIVATGLYGAEAATNNAADAIWLFNMVPGEYGCRVRTGTREYATGVPDAFSADGEVRTVALFNSVVAGGSVDFFFAFTSSGIYDITAGGAGPHTEVLAWPSTGDDAGWVSIVNYTLVDGTHALLACDEDNGYYIFDGTTWTQGTFTGSPTPAAEDLVHITEWQGRIWFVEKNSATAWFLDPLALTGSITAFDVGSRFKKGGHLVQNGTWSITAGDGLSDKFVQISSSGDVLIWEGVNPTVSDDLFMVGRWVIGAVPEGRRVMSDWGGDMLILSSNGVIKLSDIYTGRQNATGGADLTNNIARYIRDAMSVTLDDFGWSIEILPAEGILVISAPKRLDTSHERVQFVMDTSTLAWSMFRDLDMVCQDKSAKGYFFGTTDGRVMEMSGSVDNADLEGLNALPVKFSLMSHYSDVNMPGQWKRPQFVRPSWLSESQPQYGISINFDHDLAEQDFSPPFVAQPGALWDAALWDQAFWGGSAQSYLETIGVGGMGRYMAVAIRGESTVATTYIGTTVMMDSGGLL